MSEAYTGSTPEAAGLELRVFRHGELVHTEFCESEEEAVLAADRWSDFDDVECRVTDAFGPGPGPFGPTEPQEILGADADYDEMDEAGRSAAESSTGSDDRWE